MYFDAFPLGSFSPSKDEVPEHVEAEALAAIADDQSPERRASGYYDLGCLASRRDQNYTEAVSHLTQAHTLAKAAGAEELAARISRQIYQIQVYQFMDQIWRLIVEVDLSNLDEFRMMARADVPKADVGAQVMYLWTAIKLEVPLAMLILFLNGPDAARRYFRRLNEDIRRWGDLRGSSALLPLCTEINPKLDPQLNERARDVFEMWGATDCFLASMDDFYRTRQQNPEIASAHNPTYEKEASAIFRSASSPL